MSKDFPIPPLSTINNALCYEDNNVILLDYINCPILISWPLGSPKLRTDKYESCHHFSATVAFKPNYPITILFFMSYFLQYLLTLLVTLFDAFVLMVTFQQGFMKQSILKQYQILQSWIKNFQPIYNSQDRPQTEAQTDQKG